MKKLSLTNRVLLGMAFGIVVGLIVNLAHLNQSGSFINEYIVDGLFMIVGKMFITALKMLVVPLVLFSLISGVMGIGEISSLGKIAFKSFVLYLLTTAIAISTAIAVAVFFGVGEGVKLSSASNFTPKEAPPLSEVFVNIIPSNIFEAFAQGNMLQVIFFAILFGVASLMLGSRAKDIAKGIEFLNEVMMNMVTLIMSVAPYAVFALIARSIANIGLDLLVQLGAYVGVLVGVLAIHLFVTLMLLLKVFAKLDISVFLKKMRNVQIFAFGTSSSNATIPVTLRTVTNRLGADNSVASFTIPFGATINMDGTAIMQGVATIFIANAYGVDLGISQYLTVIVMSLLASIGTAGVPGVGLIMLSMVFAQVGLPVEGIGLILGVDRILDMLRTAVNVSGDAVVTMIVAKSEGKLDEQIYNDPNAGVIEQTPHIDSEVEEELAKEIENIKKIF
jgi:Na+/H+-dicarboxylate symporter